MKFHLSAPATGRPNHNREGSNEAEEKLRDCKYDVVNPARRVRPRRRLITYMRAAMRRSPTSTLIAQLDGWTESQWRTPRSIAASSASPPKTPTRGHGSGE